MIDRNGHRSSAFTLVELLVVIGVIALLIGMLLPSLASARRSAMKLKCESNLHTLGQVLVLHVNDHQGYMPLAGNITTGSTTNGFDDPQSLGDADQRRYVYYENTPGQRIVTAMPAALAQYIGKPVRDDSWQDVDADIQASGPLQDAFLCPSDDATRDHAYIAPRWINNYGTGTFLNGWTSYGVNAEVFAWTDDGVGGTVGHSRLRGKLSSVPHPAQTMLMCDTNQTVEVWVLGPQLSLGDVQLNTGGTVGPGAFDLKRHRNAINILFADGHVETQPILNSNSTPTGELMQVSMDKDFH